MPNFKPDYTKEKFTIKIIVHENCNTIQVLSNENYSPTYQEVIGALSINMHNMILDQSEHNKKEAKKQIPKFKVKAKLKPKTKIKK